MPGTTSDPAALSIALVGPRGAGKTTVGRALAGLLDLPFLDLDHEVARLAGGEETAGELLARHGEAWFRARELVALEAAIASEDRRVIATGGGIVETERARAVLARLTRAVWLRAPAEVLRRRLAADPTPRPPLLGDDSESEVERVLARREAWYREVARAAVDAGAGDPEAIAVQVGTALRGGEG